MEESQLFGTALTELLKSYQSQEKYPFIEKQFNAQDLQAKRLSFTDPGLIGAAPSVQSAARGASVSAVQPTVSGAAEAGRTFASRLETFGDVLNQGRLIQQQAEASALQQKSDAMGLIQTSIANFGPDAFTSADQKEVQQLEKLAGVPAGYISQLSKSLKAIEDKKKADEIEKENRLFQQELTLRRASQGPRQRQTATLTKLDSSGNPYEVLVDAITGKEIASGAPAPTTQVDDFETFLQTNKDRFPQANLNNAVGARQRAAAKEEFEGGQTIGLDFDINKGGKKPNQVENVRPLQKAVAVVGQLGSLQSSIKQTKTDPLIGYLKKLNPYDFDARAIQAQLQATVPNLARGVYGEVGVLTDTDIQNYIKTLPNIQSTTDQNNFVMAMTLKTVLRGYESQLETLAASGYDISGYKDQHARIKKTVTDLESEIGLGDGQRVQGFTGNRNPLSSFVIRGQ